VSLDVRGMQVVVVGLGSSGLAAARVLLDEGAAVRVTESRPRDQVAEAAAEAETAGAEVRAGGHRAADLEGAELLVTSPGVPEHAEVIGWAGQRRVRVWSELELGARLANGLAQLLAHGHAGAVAIDSDTPTLPTAFLQQGVDILRRGESDVVVGPCDDGGYYLIGVRADRPELFEDMPWSTPEVLPETLRRARTAGLATVCLPEWFDVDTAADLERLCASLGEPGLGIATRTRRFLAEQR